MDIPDETDALHIVYEIMARKGKGELI